MIKVHLVAYIHPNVLQYHPKKEWERERERVSEREREREREKTSRAITASNFLSSSTNVSANKIRFRKACYQILVTRHNKKMSIMLPSPHIWAN
jgi:hypothetical protein